MFQQERQGVACQVLLVEVPGLAGIEVTIRKYRSCTEPTGIGQLLLLAVVVTMLHSPGTRPQPVWT